LFDRLIFGFASSHKKDLGDDWQFMSETGSIKSYKKSMPISLLFAFRGIALMAMN
jgi:hypothetical protein